MIDAAFGGRSPPAVSNLVRSASLEAQQIMGFFAGKKWSDITLKTLQNDYVGDGSACLWFMTPEAAAYYLPAYLKMAVLDYYAADAISSEFMIKLHRVAEGDENNLAEGLATLNTKQNEAIARVLEVVASDYESTGVVQDATRALKLRWARYLAGS